MWHLHVRKLACLATLVACLMAGNAAWANSKVYEQALAATGWVIVPGTENTTAGTCWLADCERRLVVTSQHITGEADDVLVYFPERVKGDVVVESGYYLRKISAINGRVIARDKERDLALIQLASVPQGTASIQLAAQSCRPGEDIHSIGNSGLQTNLTQGTLWRYTRGNVRQVYAKKVSGGHAVRLVETQAPVNEGDSGGPVVNDQGRLIGVTAAYRADERLVSFNIDVQEVKAFLDSAIADFDRAAAAKVERRPVHSFAGAWTLSATNEEGETLAGNGEFKSDGTFILSPPHPENKSTAQHGRYTYANGVLWLIGDKLRASLNVTWTNQDQFSASVGGSELHFVRRQQDH